MADKINSKVIVIFFVIAFLVTWLLWIPSVLNSNGIEMPPILMLISQFALLGPGIAATMVLGKTQGKTAVKALFKNAWNWKFKKIWLIAIIVLPIAMTFGAYFIKSMIENNPIFMPETPMPIYIFIFFILIAGGPIEEFGWRGFALPKMLESMSALNASLILGLLHGIWHLPLRFMDGTVQSQIPFWEFVLITAIGAILYTWIFSNTKGSLTAAILFHWAGNIGCIFIYYDTMLGRYIFFGIQLLVALIIVISNRKKWLKRGNVS